MADRRQLEPAPAVPWTGSETAVSVEDDGARCVAVRAIAGFARAGSAASAR